MTNKQRKISKKKEASLFFAVFIEFLEAGIVSEIFFPVGNGGEKNVAADHDEFFSRPRHDHVEAVWVAQEPGHHMVPLRCGEPENNHVPFRALNPLYRINQGKFMVRPLDQTGKAGRDGVVLSAMGGDEGYLLRLNCEMGDHSAGDAGDDVGFRVAFLTMSAMIHDREGFGSIRIDQSVYVVVRDFPFQRESRPSGFRGGVKGAVVPGEARKSAEFAVHSVSDIQADAIFGVVRSREMFKN